MAKSAETGTGAIALVSLWGIQSPLMQKILRIER